VTTRSAAAPHSRIRSPVAGTARLPTPVITDASTRATTIVVAASHHVLRGVGSLPGNPWTPLQPRDATVARLDE
jgi:hypothetical protein